MSENESVKILRECIDLQIKKGQDYQNPNSRVKQAMYYPNGVHSILDIVHAKYLRIISLLESENDPNFEGIEDSFKDLINYASFGASWCRGKIDGQETIDTPFNPAKPQAPSAPTANNEWLREYMDSMTKALKKNREETMPSVNSDVLAYREDEEYKGADSSNEEGENNG